MIVIAIGIDLVELQRFRLLYGNFDPEVLARCFSPREQSLQGVDSDQLMRLAARFAAKEAILKTIGGLQDGIALTDIEILSDGVSTPNVEVSGGALTEANRRGVSHWLISMTHGTQSVAAVALAVGADPA